MEGGGLWTALGADALQEGRQLLRLFRGGGIAPVVLVDAPLAVHAEGAPLLCRGGIDRDGIGGGGDGDAAVGEPVIAQPGVRQQGGQLRQRVLLPSPLY